MNVIFNLVYPIPSNPVNIMLFIQAISKQGLQSDRTPVETGTKNGGY